MLQQFLFRIVIFFSRIIATFKPSHSLHHARFANFHELTGLLTIHIDETSLLLGVSCFNNLLRVRPTTQRRELGNFLVVGQPEAGKGYWQPANS
jgi:hypothetical protein